VTVAGARWCGMRAPCVHALSLFGTRELHRKKNVLQPVSMSSLRALVRNRLGSACSATPWAAAWRCSWRGPARNASGGSSCSRRCAPTNRFCGGLTCWPRRSGVMCCAFPDHRSFRICIACASCSCLCRTCLATMSRACRVCAPQLGVMTGEASEGPEQLARAVARAPSGRGPSSAFASAHAAAAVRHEQPLLRCCPCSTVDRRQGCLAGTRSLTGRTKVPVLHHNRRPLACLRVTLG